MALRATPEADPAPGVRGMAAIRPSLSSGVSRRCKEPGSCPLCVVTFIGEGRAAPGQYSMAHWGASVLPPSSDALVAISIGVL